MTRRHAGLRLGVVPGLDLLPVALLRVPPAALWRVHRQRACLAGKVRHVVYRLLHLALLQAEALTWRVRVHLTEEATSGHRTGFFLPQQRQAWGPGLRTSPGCLSVMPFSQPAGNQTARLGRRFWEPADSRCHAGGHQGPAARHKHAPCHSGGMDVGSCPDGQFRSPYTTHRCLPARVTPTSLVQKRRRQEPRCECRLYRRSGGPAAAHQTVPSCAGSTCCQSCPSRPAWRWARAQQLLACVCRISAVRLQCLAGAHKPVAQGTHASVPSKKIFQPPAFRASSSVWVPYASLTNVTIALPCLNIAEKVKSRRKR